MNINDIKKPAKTMVSFEVFPPKTEPNIESLFETISHLKKADPAFISVTYGAGGSGTDKSVSIASRIKSEYDIEPLAHLTCVGADKKTILSVLEDMKKNDINNVLALRGDIPKGMDKEKAFADFTYATDLIDLISNKDDMYVMAAAYPEHHPQSPTEEDDLNYLKLKQDKGVTRFNTQLCFDTDTVIRFIDDAKDMGITVPMSVGIMPILNPNQIIRMLSLSGCSIPAPLAKLFALYGNDEKEFRKFGLEYATKQAQKLLDNGVDGIHVYTMNRYKASLSILSDVGLI